MNNLRKIIKKWVKIWELPINEILNCQTSPVIYSPFEVNFKYNHNGKRENQVSEVSKWATISTNSLSLSFAFVFIYFHGGRAFPIYYVSSILLFNLGYRAKEYTKETAKNRVFGAL